MLHHAIKSSNLIRLAQRNFALHTLPKNSNQAQGLAEYAIEFMKMDNKKISDSVYDRTRLFHTDSVLCGISAIA
jgi:2-methylcitrate dehydratase